jgi:hypothetical protein
MSIYLVHDKRPDSEDNINDITYHGYYLAFRQGSADLPAVEVTYPARIDPLPRNTDSSIHLQHPHSFAEKKWTAAAPIDVRKCDVLPCLREVKLRDPRGADGDVSRIPGLLCPIRRPRKKAE